MSLQGRGSELVAQTHHVDPGIDVDVDFGLLHAESSGALDGSFGIDIDIANLGVDHPFVAEHIVSTNLEGQAKGVVQLQAAEALRLPGAAQVFLEEGGVVQTYANVGLERRTVGQRVVHHAHGRRQVLDIRQFSVQDRKSTRLNSSHVRISYAVF